MYLSMAKHERLKCLTQYLSFRIYQVYLFKVPSSIFNSQRNVGNFIGFCIITLPKIVFLINVNLRNINLKISSILIIVLFRVVFAINDYESICALFCDTQLLALETTSFIKTPLKQYLPCLPECLFIQKLFLLFLRTIFLF